MKAMINVTMLVHNRVKLTRQALESLGPVHDLTVTVLDDASDDHSTRHYLERWADRQPPQRTLVARNEVSEGTGKARNKVIDLTERVFGRGRYLYLSDNDVFFHRDWAMRLVAVYEAAWLLGFKVLGAYNHPFHQPIATENLYSGWSVREVQSLALQSMLMRWDVWDEFGPFNATEPGKVCDGEDVLFGNKIREDKGRLGVVWPPLVANCGITNSFGHPIPGADLVRAQAPFGVEIE